MKKGKNDCYTNWRNSYEQSKRSDIDVTEVIHGYIAPFVVVLSIYETFILLYIGCESVNPVFDHL